MPVGGLLKSWFNVARGTRNLVRRKSFVNMGPQPLTKLEAFFANLDRSDTLIDHRNRVFPDQGQDINGSEDGRTIKILYIGNHFVWLVPSYRNRVVFGVEDDGSKKFSNQ